MCVSTYIIEIKNIITGKINSEQDKVGDVPSFIGPTSAGGKNKPSNVTELSAGLAKEKKRALCSSKACPSHQQMLVQ